MDKIDLKDIFYKKKWNVFVNTVVFVPILNNGEILFLNYHHTNGRNWGNDSLLSEILAMKSLNLKKENIIKSEIGSARS